VKAKIVERAWDFPWSSAKAHVGGKDHWEILDMNWWDSNIDSDDWRRELAQELPDSIVSSMRSHTHSGRPLGSSRFIEKMEKKLKYGTLLPKRGRPMKKEVAEKNDRQLGLKLNVNKQKGNV
jgi:hypothetical protein